MLRRFAFLALLVRPALTDLAEADEFQPNYDEALVGDYRLPDPLIDSAGRPVDSADRWRSHRRPELLELFRRHVYGRSPARPARIRAEVRESDPQALGGRATRKQIALHLMDDAAGPTIEVLLYAPNARRPAPAFLGLNFQGNQVVHADPAIRVTSRWVRENDDHRARADSRGAQAENWPVERLIDRGYALVTAYYGDLEPDHPEGWREGVRALFPVDSAAPQVDGCVSGFRPEDWGAIGAWAWGLSCILDSLQSETLIDARRVAVVGHSRLGKTALWAGAEDERFALVISNNSGEGGAALSRRRYGETKARINTVFPHWFCDRHVDYNDRESECPVDQHELLALIAPRPLYVASATEDRWADPRGEFLAAVAAEPVYALLGRTGLGTDQWPPPDQPIGRQIGYHLRTGRHALLPYDWEQYMDFADRHWHEARGGGDEN